MAKSEPITVTMKDRPDLVDKVEEMNRTIWPEFMHKDPIGNRYWPRLFRDFPDFQFALIDPDSETVIAAGNSLPLAWNGHPKDLPDEGWDWAVSGGFEDLAAGKTPSIQCALAVTIAPTHRGEGLSSKLLVTMREIGKSYGFEDLIAPVRPNMKSRYPLAEMERYIEWRNDDGLPFDPWIRVHARLGAEVIKVCPRSMHISAPVEDWERWTKIRFPDSGEYTVPGALTPVKIDRAINRGDYLEPNVWMIHSIR